MASADTVAVAVMVIAPLLLVGRILVRASRGQPFTTGELWTALGVLAIAAQSSWSAGRQVC